jgi:ribosomal-protein-alanine N-acetyltransferase
VVVDVALRPCVADDAAALATLYTTDRDDPTLAESPPVFFTAAGQRDRITRIWREHDCLGFVAIVGGEIVGLFVLEDIADRSATVGFYVASAARGGGVATAAVGALLRVAQDDVGLVRIVADIEPGNAASRRVVERNGFEARGPVVIDGVTHDQFVVTAAARPTPEH